MPDSSLSRREIVASLICSGLYFELTVTERLALIKRIITQAPCCVQAHLG